MRKLFSITFWLFAGWLCLWLLCSLTQWRSEAQEPVASPTVAVTTDTNGLLNRASTNFFRISLSRAGLSTNIHAPTNLWVNGPISPRTVGSFFVVVTDSATNIAGSTNLTFDGTNLAYQQVTLTNIAQLFDVAFTNDNGIITPTRGFSDVILRGTNATSDVRMTNASPGIWLADTNGNAWRIAATNGGFTVGGTNSAQLVLTTNGLLRLVRAAGITGTNFLFTIEDAAGLVLGITTNGQIYAPLGAGAGKVLMSDASGFLTLTNLPGGGDVLGPASAVDNRVVRFDGNTGKIIQNSPVIVDDPGNLYSAGSAPTLGLAGVPWDNGFFRELNATNLNVRGTGIFTGVLRFTNGAIADGYLAHADTNGNLRWQPLAAGVGITNWIFQGTNEVPSNAVLAVRSDGVFSFHTNAVIQDADGAANWNFKPPSLQDSDTVARISDLAGGAGDGNAFYILLSLTNTLPNAYRMLGDARLTKLLTNGTDIVITNESGTAAFASSNQFAQAGVTNSLQPASVNLTNWSGSVTDAFVRSLNGAATNLTLYSSSPALTIVPLPGISSNSFQVLNTNLAPVVFVMSNAALIFSNADARGVITNQSLTGSRLLRSAAGKALVSSAFDDADLSALQGATNGLDAAIKQRQWGDAVLSNLVGTVARNVTNLISLSTSNATSKPITNAYANGVLTIFGLQAGANVTLTPNESNLVIAATGGGAGALGLQTNSVQLGSETNLNLLEGNGIVLLATNVAGTNQIQFAVASSVTNGLNTRVGNLEGATNGLDAAIQERQYGSLVLTNLSGTGAITNLVNAATNLAAGMFGWIQRTNNGDAALKTIAQGSNITITDQGTNLLVTASAAAGALTVQTNSITLGTETNLNLIEGAGITLLATNVSGTNQIQFNLNTITNEFALASMTNFFLTTNKVGNAAFSNAQAFIASSDGLGTNTTLRASASTAMPLLIQGSIGHTNHLLRVTDSNSVAQFVVRSNGWLGVRANVPQSELHFGADTEGGNNPITKIQIDPPHGALGNEAPMSIFVQSFTNDSPPRYNYPLTIGYNAARELSAEPSLFLNLEPHYQPGASNESMFEFFWEWRDTNNVGTRPMFFVAKKYYPDFTWDWSARVHQWYDNSASTNLMKLQRSGGTPAELQVFGTVNVDSNLNVTGVGTISTLTIDGRAFANTIADIQPAGTTRFLNYNAAGKRLAIGESAFIAFNGQTNVTFESLTGGFNLNATEVTVNNTGGGGDLRVLNGSRLILGQGGGTQWRVFVDSDQNAQVTNSINNTNLTFFLNGGARFPGNVDVRGFLTNQQLTASRFVRSAAAKALVSSSFDDADISNLQGATNGLDAAVKQRQFGDAVLTNLVGTVGNNVTNGNANQFTITTGTLSLNSGALITNQNHSGTLQLTNPPGGATAALRVNETNGRGYTEFTVTNSVIATNQFVFSIGSNTPAAGHVLKLHSATISGGVNTLVLTNDVDTALVQTNGASIGSIGTLNFVNGMTGYVDGAIVNIGAALNTNVLQPGSTALTNLAGTGAITNLNVNQFAGPNIWSIIEQATLTNLQLYGAAKVIAVTGQPDEDSGVLRLIGTNNTKWTQFGIVNQVHSTNDVRWSWGSNTVSAGHVLKVHSTAISGGINTMVLTNDVDGGGAGITPPWTNDNTTLRPVDVMGINRVAFRSTNAGDGLWITNRAPEVNLVNTNTDAGRWRLRMTTADALSFSHPNSGQLIQSDTNGLTYIKSRNEPTTNQSFMVVGELGDLLAVETNGMFWLKSNRFAFNVSTNVWPLTNGLAGQKLSVNADKTLYWSDDAAGTGTNNLIQTNGVTVGSIGTLDFVAGITGYVDGGVVKLGVSAAGGGGGGGFTNNGTITFPVAAGAAEVWVITNANGNIGSDIAGGGAVFSGSAGVYNIVGQPGAELRLGSDGGVNWIMDRTILRPDQDGQHIGTNGNSVGHVWLGRNIFSKEHQDSAGSGANTNILDFATRSFLGFTNQLVTNHVFIVSNVFEGVSLNLSVYGADGAVIASNYTFTVQGPSDTRIIWFTSTNGSQDVIVTSNKIGMLSLFADRKTNVFAAWREQMP